MPYKLGQNHDASRLAQLALFYDALVQLYLTLDSIPKLPLLGRQRCPDLVHPECGVARRQVWSEVGASVELRLSKIAHFSWPQSTPLPIALMAEGYGMEVTVGKASRSIP